MDADGTVENTSDDPWIRFIYDDRWRIVGTFRASDSSPKEQFVYHNAGVDGRGRSSYIDTVILRDRDANVNWADAADGTLEERIYYCHNWRGDVSVLIEDDADMVEWVKYSSYGIPFGLPKGDADSDGDVDVGDTADTDQIQTWIDASAYDERGDLDMDGDVDATDKSLATTVTLGWGKLSEDPDSGAGNRKGYAGYEFDDVLASSASIHHVRNRVYHAELGRFTRRDPLGYVDGSNLYQYVRSNPLAGVDPRGTAESCPLCPFGAPGDDDDDQGGPQNCVGGRQAPGCAKPTVDPDNGPEDDEECDSACAEENAVLGRITLGVTLCSSDGCILVCICFRTIDDNFNSFKGVQMITECATVHETTHISHMDCLLGKICGDRNCNECEAHTNEMLCLLSKCGEGYPESGDDCDMCYDDPVCIEDMRRYAEGVRERQQHYCSKCGDWPP